MHAWFLVANVKTFKQIPSFIHMVLRKTLGNSTCSRKYFLEKAFAKCLLTGNITSASQMPSGSFYYILFTLLNVIHAKISFIYYD